MNLITFENPVFGYYALAAALMIVKMMSQGWITVFRMLITQAGFRNPEDTRRSYVNRRPSPDQILPNEYVERSRRIHQNDAENIPLFLGSGLLFVCTGPSPAVAATLFSTYVLSRLVHFYVVMAGHRTDIRAFLWSIGSVIVYIMAGVVVLHALRG